MMLLRSLVLISILFYCCLLTEYAKAENGTIKGRIMEQVTRKPVPFANIVVEGTSTGATSGEDGYFEIANVLPGYVRLVVSYVGFKTKITEEIFVTKEK